MRQISAILVFQLLFGLLNGHSQSLKDSLLAIIETANNSGDKQETINLFFDRHQNSLPSFMLAECYHEAGNKWYFSNWKKNAKPADLDSAITFTSRAVEIKKQIDSVSISSLKKSLYNLAYFYWLEGDYYESKNGYLELIDAGEEDTKTVLAHYRLAQIYNEVGDYQKAIDRLNLVIDYYKRNPVNQSRLLNTHLEIAATYSLMSYEKYADDIFEHLGVADSIYESFQNKDDFKKIRIAQQKGNLLIFLNRYEAAIEELKVVQELSEVLNNTELAYNYNSLGVCYDKLGLNDVANIHFTEALKLFPDYSSPYENLGDMYRDNGEYEKALISYQQSVSLSSNQEIIGNYRLNPSLEDINLARDKTYLLKHLVAKANFLIEYYKYSSNDDYLIIGLETFELCDRLIDLIRIESTETQTQLYWREQSANLYLKAVETCYLLNEPEKAYYFMERNKALLLLENISNERAKDISQLPDSIAQREFELKRKIYLAENDLSNAGTDVNTRVIRDSIFRHKREFEIFLDEVETSYPDYARLKTQLEILSFEDFKTHYLNDEQVVVQYILNEEQGYGLLHSAGGTEFFKIEDASKVNQELKRLNKLLSNYNLQNDDNSAYSELAYRLFHSLLPEKGLDILVSKKLLIIPDYELQRIPFEALIVQQSPIKYLLEETEIGYAYSVSYLHSKKNNAKSANDRLLSFAPVSFDSQGLAKLAFSLDEVDGIQEIIGGELYKETEATKNVFLKQLNKYEILHLSTHADIDENGNHWVAFRNEKLHLNEIYANRNQADMVVLSACNTSRGDLKRGEGVMSLARAFFNSGAKSVVSSLWTVQDRAGKEIMLEFYRGLDEGMTKSQALRQAKLFYLQNNSGRLAHPFLWASLIVIGDNDAIEGSVSLWDYWPMLLAMVLMILFFLNRSRRLNSDRGLSNPLP